MAIKTYSIDKDIAKKFKDQTPEQETSNVLEQLMRDYIDEQPDQEIVLDLVNTGLSDSKQELLEAMIDENINRKGNQPLFGLARSQNIYGRSHHFGKGLKSIVTSDEIPYTREGDKIVSDTLQCSCNARFPINLFIDEGGDCPSCGKKAVRLP